jgi:hypothetical protein
MFVATSDIGMPPMHTAAFARKPRPERTARVAVRVSAAERRELERLARENNASVSDIVRDGLAAVRRLHDDAETVCGTD